MRKCKCKYCDEYIIEENDKYTIQELTKSGNGKKINLHKGCIDDYNELMAYKEEEIKWFNNVYEYIMTLLDYNDTQKLPSYLITRIQDLRNGTIVERGVGRVVKSKNGYTYKTILNTLLTLSDKIRWSFSNKEFKNEKNKINYMMAIVDSNINDLVIADNSKTTKNDLKERNGLIKDESINVKRKTIEYIPQSKGISKFLDEDDL